MSALSYDEYLSKVQGVLRRQNKTISKESLSLILEASSKGLLEALRESPTVHVAPFGWFEVTPLARRIHVLRGKTYESHTRYKLKLYMAKDLLENVSEIYDQYREDE